MLTQEIWDDFLDIVETKNILNNDTWDLEKLNSLLRRDSYFERDEAPEILKILLEQGSLLANQTKIPNYLFMHYKGLININIPEGVTSIGESTFFGCASLTSINIPEGVTSIGDYAFYGCSNLTSINIPEGVTSIGEGAFYLCNGLDPKLLVYDKGTKCYGWIGDEEKCTFMQ